jgi:hypothetical protein
MYEFDKFVSYWGESSQAAFYEAHAYFLGKGRVLSLEAEALSDEERAKLMAYKVPAGFEKKISDRESVDQLTEAQQSAEEVLIIIITRTLAGSDIHLQTHSDTRDIVNYWERVSGLTKARAILNTRTRQQV